MSVEVASGHQQLAVGPSLHPAGSGGTVVSVSSLCKGIAGRVPLGAHGGPEKVDAQGVPDVIACVGRHGEGGGFGAVERKRGEGSIATGSEMGRDAVFVAGVKSVPFEPCRVREYLHFYVPTAFSATCERD